VHRKRRDISIKKIAYKEVVKLLENLVELIASQLKASSNGYIPKDFPELFSEKSANIICKYHNIYAKTHIYPYQTWIEHLQNRKELFYSAINLLKNQFIIFLPEKMIEYLSQIGKAEYFLLIGMRNDMQIGTKKVLKKELPPIFAPSADFEANIIKDFKLFLEIIDFVNKECKQLKLESVKFPEDIFKSTNFPKLGSARYSQNNSYY